MVNQRRGGEEKPYLLPAERQEGGDLFRVFQDSQVAALPRTEFSMGNAGVIALMERGVGRWVYSAVGAGRSGGKGSTLGWGVRGHSRGTIN
jgi:hypothetical protein